LNLATEATSHNARLVRVRFQRWLREVGARPAVVDDVTLAVYEALANAVEHAYHPHHPNPVMHLQARIDHTHLLIIGRGLAMMRSLTTEVQLCPTR
jgi:anti-sigma regulatory factor (Ser/Thr protein kinase)